MKHALPNIGLIGGFVENEDGWGPDMNANLAGLSVLVQASVAGRVDELPGSPAQGDVYILTTDQRIAYYDEGGWRYIVPQAGYTAYDRALAVRLEYDGAAWAEIVAGEGGGGGGGGAVDRRVRFVTLTHFNHYTDGGSVSRMRFRRPNGTDLPTPTILYDGVGVGGYPFAQALDDNANSFFSTYQGSLVGVIVLDFGALVEIKDIAVTNRIEGSATQALTSFVAYGKKVLAEPGVEIATAFFDLAGWNANNVTRNAPLGFVNEGAVAPPGPTGYTKYRVYITQGNNASQVCMGELRCYDDAVAGTDFTDQNTGIFYSAQAGGNVAANVFDNQAGNGWFDTNPPINFIGFNLAEPKPLARYTIELFFREDYMPRDFQLQGSNDGGATWTTLHTVTGKTSWVGVESFVVPQ